MTRGILFTKDKARISGIIEIWAFVCIFLFRINQTAVIDIVQYIVEVTFRQIISHWQIHIQVVIKAATDRDYQEQLFKEFHGVLHSTEEIVGSSGSTS